MTFVLIGFIICFSAGLLLSVALIYRDVKPDEHSSDTYFWERVLAIIFDTFQASLSIAGIAAAMYVLHSGGTIYWLDMAIRCNLQLFTGTNLARILRVLMFSHWTIWLAYMFAFLTALIIVYLIKDSDSGSTHDSKPLYLLAVASLLSSAASQRRLEGHKESGSGQRPLGYKRLLTVFVTANATAALCQLCGAIVIDSIFLADREIDTSLRQGIYLLSPSYCVCAI